MALPAGTGARLRSAYVNAARTGKRAATATGLLEWADARARQNPRGPVAHARSLLAIHDVEDMVALGQPWWTYRAIDAVDAFLRGRRGQARVFEFGSGASTIWLAGRAAEVHSVESHEGFAHIVQTLLDERDGLASRVQLHVVPPTPSADPEIPSGRGDAQGQDFARYVDTVRRVGGEFDLVIVDGRARVACLEAAMPYLAEQGVLLLDDSQRPRYASALHREDAQVRRYKGLSPTLPYPRETSLLFRR